MQIREVKIGMEAVFRRPPARTKRNGFVTAIKIEKGSINHRLQIDGKFWIYSRNVISAKIEEALYLE